MLLTKIIIQGMLNIFYILSEKVDFFYKRGSTPPLIANMSAKKLIFFYALPYKTYIWTKCIHHKTYQNKTYPPQNISEQNVSTTKHIWTKRIHHKTYPNKTYPPQNISEQNISTTKHIIRTKRIHHKTYTPQNASTTKCIQPQNVYTKKRNHYQTYLTTKCIHFFAILMYYLLEFFFWIHFAAGYVLWSDMLYYGYILLWICFEWKRFVQRHFCIHHCILSACIKILYALEKLNIVIPVAWFFPPVIYSGPHPS